MQSRPKYGGTWDAELLLLLLWETGTHGARLEDEWSAWVDGKKGWMERQGLVRKNIMKAAGPP